MPLWQFYEISYVIVVLTIHLIKKLNCIIFTFPCIEKTTFVPKNLLNYEKHA